MSKDKKAGAGAGYEPAWKGTPTWMNKPSDSDLEKVLQPQTRDVLYQKLDEMRPADMNDDDWNKTKDVALAGVYALANRNATVKQVFEGLNGLYEADELKYFTEAQMGEVKEGVTQEPLTLAQGVLKSIVGALGIGNYHKKRAVTLEEELGTKTERVTELEGEIAALEGKVTDLEGQVNDYEGRQIKVGESPFKDVSFGTVGVDYLNDLLSDNGLTN